MPIAIPSNYLALVGIEYNDKSIWEPRKPGNKTYAERTFEDAAHAFTIYVRWPDMAPRSPVTEKSYWDSNTKPGEHQWLMVGVADSDSENGYGLARVLRGNIKQLAERPQTRKLSISEFEGTSRRNGGGPG